MISDPQLPGALLRIAARADRSRRVLGRPGPGVAPSHGGGFAMSVATRAGAQGRVPRPVQFDAIEGFAIRPDDTVVDVGCGAGVGCRYAGSQGAEVIGLDTEPSLIEAAGAAMRGTPARAWRGIVTDCDPIPLPDGTASVVICTEVLEHVPHGIPTSGSSYRTRLVVPRLQMARADDRGLALCRGHHPDELVPGDEQHHGRRDVLPQPLPPFAPEGGPRS